MIMIYEADRGASAINGFSTVLVNLTAFPALNAARIAAIPLDADLTPLVSTRGGHYPLHLTVE